MATPSRSSLTSRPRFLDLSNASPFRKLVGDVLYDPMFDGLIGAVLTFNFAVMVVDTDKRASGQTTPLWINVASDLCSIVYLFEFLARLYVEQKMVLRNSWNRLDLTVLILSVVEKIISALTELNPTSLLLVRAVRIVRLFRLVRALKLLSALRELRKLVQMILMCVKTLFWSCFLTFILMSMWSVILVELISPIVARLEIEQGIWDGDADWTQSYSTVMRANLTLFQTIVAGDSWGKVPIPVIAEAPWAVLVFLPAHVTLVFGVLNLILAVVVDTFAEVRATDQAARLAELEDEERIEKHALNKIFESIDEDRSGSVTLDELEQGAIENDDLRQRLRIMDVTKADLQLLFEIIDEDGSGDIDPEEFIDTLYRLKCSNSQSAAVMVKHTVGGVMKRQERVESQLTQVRQSLASLCSSQQLCQTDGAPGDDPGENPGVHPGGDHPHPLGGGVWEPLASQSTTDPSTPRKDASDAPQMPLPLVSWVPSPRSPRSPGSPQRQSPQYSPRTPHRGASPTPSSVGRPASLPTSGQRNVQGLLLPRGANGRSGRVLLVSTTRV